MLSHLKNVFRLLLALGVAGVAGPVLAQGPPPAAPVTYQAFYDALSPYGQWVDDPDYGNAWVPTAGPDFQPYRTNGHWVYTDYGWTWVSDYQWGWAAFHYGRWRYSDAFGWLWVPGYSWGPAWVAWRQSAGYYGWAPLGPPPPPRGGVHVSIGFSFSFGDAPVAPARWCFVPAAYVASPAIATYYVPPTQTTVVYNNTTVIHSTYVNNSVPNVSNTNVSNTTVVNQRNRNTLNQGGGTGQPAFPAGPARADVEKATGQPLTPLVVSNRARPGVGVQGKSLAFYRPEVAAPAPTGPRSSAAGVGPAPQKIVPLAQAARQARRPPADPNRGLMRDNAARHLSSTDADPIRMAKQQAQAAAPTSGPGPTTAGPRAATTTRPGRPLEAAVTAANRQLPKEPPPGYAPPAPALAAPTIAAPTSRPTPPDNNQRQQARHQAQAARQQQHDQQQHDQQQQAQEQKQQAKQPEQPARQQAQQAHQQQAEQARQQARQQRPAHPPQVRPPHPEGREAHR